MPRREDDDQDKKEDKENEKDDDNDGKHEDEERKGGEGEDKMVVGNCPAFSCTAGSTIDGKFYGRNDGNDDHADGFYRVHLDASVSGNAQLDCYKACAQFNLAHPGETWAAYFQYEPTPEDKGGNCQCFGAEACSGSHYASPAEGSLKSFSVGKICSSDGKGDPHFRGADGSRYDFSGQ